MIVLSTLVFMRAVHQVETLSLVTPKVEEGTMEIDDVVGNTDVSLSIPALQAPPPGGSDNISSSSGGSSSKGVLWFNGLLLVYGHVYILRACRPRWRYQ